MSTLESDDFFRTQQTGSIGDVAVWELAGFSILLFACFFNLISLDASKDEIRLDIQVYVKLAVIACCGLYGAIGFLTDSRVRLAALSFPAAWILAIFGLYVLASLRAYDTKAAVASSFSILFVYLMTITAAVSLGKETAVKAIFYGAALFVFGSWIVYLVRPEIGVMEEPVAGGEFVSRMSGLGHANTLGQFAGCCVILGSILCWHRKPIPRLWLIIIALAILALIMSYSRAAMVATAGGLAVACRKMIFQRAIFNWFMFLAIVGLLGLMLASISLDWDRVKSKYLSAISKSGDAEEITTATGRGEIWGKSIQLIKEQPALGYGPTSSKYLLEDYSLYTHNLWLNVGLNCGVVGFLAAVLMCVSRLGMLFTHYSAIADGLFFYIVLNGLFENIIFSNLCGLPTICWVLALAWFQIDSMDKRAHE